MRFILGLLFALAAPQLASAEIIRRSGDYDTLPPRHAQNFFAETDCGSGGLTTAGTGDFIGGANGAAAATRAVTTEVTGAWSGLCELGTGTVATNRVSISLAWNAAIGSRPGPLNLANGPVTWFAAFDEGVASTGTDTYTLRNGILDDMGAEPTDGCYFRYTHSVNSGKWQIVARSNGVETGTALDSGITFTPGTRRYFKVIGTSTSCSFYSSGVQVTNSPLSANIPAGANRSTGAGVAALKSVGIADVVPMYLDYMYVLQVPTVPRNWSAY